MTNWYVGSVEYTAVAQWAASHAYSVGAIVRQLAAPAVGSERCWRCTTAGTSGASEPSWTLTHASTTSDNGAVWTEVTGQQTYQAPGAWAAPHARLSNALASGWAAAGDSIFISSDHAETQSTALTATFPGSAANPNYCACVDQTSGSAVPPGSTNLKTTGTISTTGSSGITVGGSAYIYGLGFSAGTGSGTASINAGNNNAAEIVFDTCSFTLGTTSASSFIEPGNQECRALFVNATVQFGATTQSIDFQGNCGGFRWMNTSAAIQGAILPVNLFKGLANISNNGVLLDGVDLSALGASTMIVGGNFVGQMVLQNCKLGAAVTVAASGGEGTQMVDVVISDSVGTTYRSERYWYEGIQTTETALTRSGGASDGVQAISWNLSSGANCSFLHPFEAIQSVIWNTQTGSSVTVTGYGIANAAALPNNDQVWFDVKYLGSSSAPIASLASGTKANFLATGTALSADTSSWGAGVPARANSTSYSNGNEITVPDNSGRVFFCTTAGSSAASEPAGYATAVDGGSVTDGTAVFRAGVRFSLSVSVTSQLIGDVRVLWKVANASSTYWVDPQPTVS